MQEGGIGPDGVSRCLLIDGQQRLTSVTLLLIALAEFSHTVQTFDCRHTGIP